MPLSLFLRATLLIFQEVVCSCRLLGWQLQASNGTELAEDESPSSRVTKRNEDKIQIC